MVDPGRSLFFWTVACSSSINILTGAVNSVVPVRCQSHCQDAKTTGSGHDGHISVNPADSCDTSPTTPPRLSTMGDVLWGPYHCVPQVLGMQANSLPSRRSYTRVPTSMDAKAEVHWASLSDQDCDAAARPVYSSASLAGVRDVDTLSELYGAPIGRFLRTPAGLTHFHVLRPRSTPRGVVVCSHGLGSNCRDYDGAYDSATHDSAMCFYAD